MPESLLVYYRVEVSEGSTVYFVEAIDDLTWNRRPPTGSNIISEYYNFPLEEDAQNASTDLFRMMREKTPIKSSDNSLQSIDKELHEKYGGKSSAMSTYQPPKKYTPAVNEAKESKDVAPKHGSLFNSVASASPVVESTVSGVSSPSPTPGNPTSE